MLIFPLSSRSNPYCFLIPSDYKAIVKTGEFVQLAIFVTLLIVSTCLLLNTFIRHLLVNSMYADYGSKASYIKEYGSKKTKSNLQASLMGDI